MAQIGGPVGRWEDTKVISRRGNRRDDIMTIQRLLKNAAAKKKNSNFDPGIVDGKIARAPRSSNTIKAIKAFQHTILSRNQVDGRVDVSGTTLRKLNELESVAPQPPAAPQPTLPPTAARADMYYIAAKNATRERTDGRFYLPSKNFSCIARSGSRTLHPLPDGEYKCNNFRHRTDDAMTRDKVGFSVDLSDKYDPDLGRDRTLLRIHPDGGLAGTAGCVGILDDVAKCGELLEELLPAGTIRKLVVLTVESASDVPTQVWQSSRVVEQAVQAVP